MSTNDEPRLPPSALLEMAQAYRQSAILTTACQLDVFTHLAGGPLSAEALAHACGVPVRGLRRLLNACVVLELLEKEGETYRNTPIADTFLVKGTPGSMGNFIARAAENYKAWGQLGRAIREDRPIDPHSADMLDTLPPDRVRHYVESLYDTGRQAAMAIADAVDLTHARRMLDVAGGSGIYSITFAQRQPALRAVVFDLPPILAFTQEIIARHGMAGQLSVHPGNYHHDELGSGYDVVLLSNVLQTQGVQTGQMLLRKAFNALAPGGQLLIHGAMPSPDRVSPPEPALTQVHMFLVYPEGDAHPAEDICAWAQEAGFIDVSVTRFPPPRFRSLITGRKPR
ncbi:MAG: methyltransferase domain-containing protein [Nitrospinae bacterium]|nr:methyltransferase domain-containing protein [Nitrospinota bacterium]